MRSVSGMFAPVINSRLLMFTVKIKETLLFFFYSFADWKLTVSNNWLFSCTPCWACRCEDVYVPWNVWWNIWSSVRQAASWFGFRFYFGSSIFCSHLLWVSLFAVTLSCFYLTVEQQRQRSNKSEQQHLLVTSCIIPGHRQTCKT